MKLLTRSALIVALLGWAAVGFAQEGGKKGDKPAGGAKVEKAEKGEKGGKQALEDIVVTGKLTKQEAKGREGKKPAEGATAAAPAAHYVVTDANGQVINIAPQKPAEGAAAPAIDLEKYVGKQVTVTGKGRTHEPKKEGEAKKTYIVEVLRVDEVVAPAAAPAGK